MKKKLFAMVLVAVMSVCFCACGETEKEVEITTAPPEQQEAQDAKDISSYEAVYNEYKSKMREATDKYVEELKGESKGLSKDELYDKVKEKNDALGKIREEGNQKMTDAMLASTEDDQKTYEKWYNKLTEVFTDYSREITAVYTDNF